MNFLVGSSLTPGMILNLEGIWLDVHEFPESHEECCPAPSAPSLVLLCVRGLSALGLEAHELEHADGLFTYERGVSPRHQHAER